MTTAFILILFFFNFYAHIHKYFRLLSTRVVCATFQTRFYSRRGSVGSLPFRFLFPFGNSTSAGWVHDLIASNPLPSPLKFPAAAASLIELPFRINDKETRWRGASTQIYTHTHTNTTLSFSQIRSIIIQAFSCTTWPRVHVPTKLYVFQNPRLQRNHEFMSRIMLYNIIMITLHI